MNLKTNRQIDRLIEAIPSRRAQRAADEFVSSATVVEEAEKGEALDQIQDGIRKGMRLMEVFARRKKKYGHDVPRDFGIYIAAQPTSDGEDLFYFVGSAKDIIAKLKRIEETET